MPAVLNLKMDISSAHKTEMHDFVDTKADDVEALEALALNMNTNNAYSKHEVNAYFDAKPVETEVAVALAMIDEAISLNQTKRPFITLSL